MTYTFVISHSRDQDYINHFLSIMEKIPVFKESKIWIDGWYSKYSGTFPAWKITEHTKPHGERCYENLQESETDLVFIIDSDFFCNDINFWEDSIKAFSDPNIYLVSLGTYYKLIGDFPTTPFTLYRRKEVLDFVPIKELWNHFGRNWPNLKEPVFDHLKFVHLSLCWQNHVKCIDKINPAENLKYKHYHFWDSRDFPEENFTAFDEKNNPMTLLFLTYGICKYFYKVILGKNQMTDKHWNYIKVVIDTPFYKQYIVDFFKNIRDQLLNDEQRNIFDSLQQNFKKNI